MTPQRLGRYDVVKKLGDGGMGVVWQAHDPSIDRFVAIKVIAVRENCDIPALRAHFRAEMQALGRLWHRNIVRILDAEIASGQAYIVMEKLEGSDLRTRLKGGEAFPIPRSIDIVRQVLSALEHAHKMCVVHGDLKPANVMLDENHVATVCDFGAARFVEPEATIMRWPDALSPDYASPEQVKGETVDFRTDVFAAAIMLYVLVTGNMPDVDTSEAEILRGLTAAIASSGEDVGATVLAAIAKVLWRALRPNPKERFESASAFSAAMVAAGQKPTSTSPDTAAAPRSRRALVVWGPRLMALPFFFGWIATQPVLPTSPVSGFVAQAVVQPEPIRPLEIAHPTTPPAAQLVPEGGPQFALAAAQQSAHAQAAARAINQTGTVSARPDSVVPTSANTGTANVGPRTTVAPLPMELVLGNDSRRSSMDLAVVKAEDALDTNPAVSVATSTVNPRTRLAVSDVCRDMSWFEHVKCIVATCSMRANWHDPECNQKGQEP